MRPDPGVRLLVLALAHVASARDGEAEPEARPEVGGQPQPVGRAHPDLEVATARRGSERGQRERLAEDRLMKRGADARAQQPGPGVGDVATDQPGRELERRTGGEAVANLVLGRRPWLAPDRRRQLRADRLARRDRDVARRHVPRQTGDIDPARVEPAPRPLHLDAHHGGQRQVDVDTHGVLVERPRGLSRDGGCAAELDLDEPAQAALPERARRGRREGDAYDLRRGLFGSRRGRRRPVRLRGRPGDAQRHRAGCCEGRSDGAMAVAQNDGMRLPERGPVKDCRQGVGLAISASIATTMSLVAKLSVASFGSSPGHSY